MPSNIFISYSHTDNWLVTPIVALLRASQALVFRDADTIRPGKKWHEEIHKAIKDASVVVIFWCHHSSLSEEVEKEFRTAITLNKDILPLLLDMTPLPPELAEFQYIDFREFFFDGHSVTEPMKNNIEHASMAQPYFKQAVPLEKKSNTSKYVLILLTVIFFSVLFFSFGMGLYYLLHNYSHVPLSKVVLITICAVSALFFIIKILKWNDNLQNNVLKQDAIVEKFEDWTSRSAANKIEKELFRIIALQAKG